MKIASFQDMVLEYEIAMIELDSNNLELRNNLLKTFKYSFIIEGEENEIENLLKWIDVNLQLSLENIFYGKVDYNYHFAEFFLNNEFALKSIIELIQTFIQFIQILIRQILSQRLLELTI